jgi:hypothetical protein
LARLASCDSDQDAFNSATGPAAGSSGGPASAAPPRPPAAPARQLQPSWGAAPAVPAPAVPPYLDVADGVDDLALGRPRRFVRHDQEDVVDVMVTADAGVLRPRPRQLGGRRQRAYGSAPAVLGAAGHGALWAGAGCFIGETPAGVAAPPRPPLALAPRTVAALTGEWGGGSGSQDGLTACSATGSPTVQMVSTMQVSALGLRGCLSLTLDVHP